MSTPNRLHPDRQTYSIEETARLLGVNRSTAYELARHDRLPVPVIRLGRRMVVGRVALDRLLAGSTTTDPEAA